MARDLGERPVRTFIALELEEPARAEVERYLAPLRSEPGVAWAAAENLHVTVKFLGGVQVPRLEPLTRRLAAVAASEPPFTMMLAGVGAFPSMRRPRVLWIAAVAAELAGLAAAVERACAAEGFASESRPFHAHVTLGRVRDGPRGRRGGADRDVGPRLAMLEADQERTFGLSWALALVLFRSDLGPRGARYTPLARLELRGDASGPARSGPT